MGLCGGGGGGGVKQTQEQQAQMEINAKLWNYNMSSYRPQIQKYEERVMSPVEQEAEKRQVSGQIRAEAMKNITPANVSENPVETAVREGGIPKGEAGTQVEGHAKVRSRQLGEMQNLISIGRGQATTAQAGMGEIASESVSAEIKGKELDQMEQAGTENMFGSVIGLGAAAYKEGMRGTTPTPTRTLNPIDFWGEDEQGRPYYIG